MNEGRTHQLPVSDQYELQADALGRVICGRERTEVGEGSNPLAPASVGRRKGPARSDGRLRSLVEFWVFSGIFLGIP